LVPGEQEQRLGVAAFPPQVKPPVQVAPQLTGTPQEGLVTVALQAAPPVPGHIDASVSVQQVAEPPAGVPQWVLHACDVYLKSEPQVFSVSPLQTLSPGWHSPPHAGLVVPPVQVKAQVWTTMVHWPSPSHWRTAGSPLPSVPHILAPGAQTPPQVFS